MIDVLRRFRLAIAACAVIGLLAACDNTIRGVGQDAEETGDAIGDAVQ